MCFCPAVLAPSDAAASAGLDVAPWEPERPHQWAPRSGFPLALHGTHLGLNYFGSCLQPPKLAAYSAPTGPLELWPGLEHSI